MEKEKAFKEIVPIHIDDISIIIRTLSNLLNLNLIHCLLGSAGKKILSNDLDIGIDDSIISYSDLENLLTNAYKNLYYSSNDIVVKPNKGLQQIYTLYPFKNNQIQIDFMVGKLNWMKFSYFSPDQSQSLYSGVYRTLLLRIIASTINKYEYWDNKNLIIKTGYIWDMNQGLRFETRFRRKRQNGIGYLEKFESAYENKIFHSEWPHYQIKAPQYITDTSEVLHILFNKTNLNVDTFENVYDALTRSHKLNRPVIEHFFKEQCIRNKLSIPVFL